MNTDNSAFRFAMLSLALLLIAVALTLIEANASYEIKVAPDTMYKTIAVILNITGPVSFVFALLSVSAKKSKLGTILCILSGLGTLMAIMSLINSAYQP